MKGNILGQETEITKLTVHDLLYFTMDWASGNIIKKKAKEYFLLNKYNQYITGYPKKWAVYQLNLLITFVWWLGMLNISGEF